MEQKYDHFNDIGKRLPYSVPDGFFTSIEEQVMHEVKNDLNLTKQAKHKSKATTWIKSISIAAAAALVLIVGYKFIFKANTTNDFNSVEQAFTNLSEDDQDFLLEVYQEDIFLDEGEEEINEVI